MARPITPDVDDGPNFEGTWIIKDGTGDYANLEGSGSYQSSTEPIWTEVYTGEMDNG